MRLPTASPRDITSIQNWLHGTGSIAGPETDFLSHPHDLANLTGTLDSAVLTIETFIERLAFFLSTPIRSIKRLPESLKPGRHDLTSDPHIFFAGPRLRSFSRAVTSWIAASILLAPVVVLFCVQDAVGSYAAVLVVFTSASNALRPEYSARLGD
ncbi:hypothetical protein J4E81_001925 [Alternaria sp. BMP 2799]|nr:hypothetical protein J4E81_001925 [Alternaria sp. BMP 2799]